MPTFSSVNPSTGALLGDFPVDSPDVVRSRVERARSASASWAATPLRDRLRVLKTLRTNLAASAPDLARAISAEIGKPYAESLAAELIPTLDGLDFLIKSSPRVLKPRRISANLNSRLMGFRHAFVHREPLGVVAILGTWNYPVFLNVLQISSALAAGNAVVWKPSELAPHVATKTLDLFRRSGVPEGLLEMVSGGRETGAALAEAACDKYILTGGLSSGRALLAALAPNVRPAILELSGQDAAVLLADADPVAAARSLVWGAFINCGQSCVAVRRIYYHPSLESTFVPAFLDAVNKFRVGDPSDPLADLGPLRTPQLLDRIDCLVQSARSSGAKVLAGGHRLDRPSGNFFAPTVLAGIDESSSIFQDDVFGPVTFLIPVSDPAEAVRRANTSRFGLGASVWTRNRRRGELLARALQAGVVSVNACVLPVADSRLPFGGFKATGYGRTHGDSGLLEMTAERVVASYNTLPPGHGTSFPYGPNLAPMLEGLFAYRAAQSALARAKALNNLFGRFIRFIRG